MTAITDEMRAQMQAINANLNHTRVKKTGARYTKYDRKKGKVVEIKRPNAIVGHSMFPYTSSAMACNPEDISQMREFIRQHADVEAKYTEFDETGRPIITSTEQHKALAKVLEMRTGRDGSGHKDEHGNFQNSGRRRADEMKAGRAKVRRLRDELEQMPDDVPSGAVAATLDEYDIRPTEDNTG